MFKDINRLVELILSYALAAGMVGVSVFLVEFRGWYWVWFPIGLFTCFLFVGWTKIEPSSLDKSKSDRS